MPLYYQVAQLIRTEISEGGFAVGEQIPAERDLLARYGVSRITVRQAIDSLVQEGILLKQQGRGTFVLGVPARDTMTELAGSLESIEELGKETDVRLLSASFVLCPSPIGRDLKTDAKEHVLKVLRIRSSNALPFAYLTNWLAERWASQIDLNDLRQRSLLAQLRDLGTMPDSADQTITATLATPEVSQLLETPVGSPMLKGYRVYFHRGEPIMVLESLYRPDRYAYRVRLSAKSPQLAGIWLAGEES